MADGSVKYQLILVLYFNRELRIADHYLRPLSESYIYLTAMVNRRSLFNRIGLVIDQLLTDRV